MCNVIPVIYECTLQKKKNKIIDTVSFGLQICQKEKKEDEINGIASIICVVWFAFSDIKQVFPLLSFSGQILFSVDSGNALLHR